MFINILESIIKEVIEKALQEANKNKVHGKEVTPYLLAAIAKATGGASLNSS